MSNRIPEISDELYKIDDAMKAGLDGATGLGCLKKELKS
jgi:hypothetical protein